MTRSPSVVRRARRLVSSVAISTALALFTLGPSAALAASSTVECGQLTGYAAPDPVAPTDGIVQIGSLTPWVIHATATLSPAAASALPTIVNSGPTCLAIDLDDDGKVTAIDFAAQGTIQGGVEFDSGNGFYMFANRLMVPTFITDAYPGLAALFVTSYQAGTQLTVTFSADTTSGQLLGFDGTAAFCGLASVTSGGDGQVGDAVIPASVLDAGDLAKLAGAGNRSTCASVHAVGTLGSQGAIQITTDVEITVAAPGATPRIPTAPPTSIATAAPLTTDNPLAAMAIWLGGAVAAALIMVTRQLRSSQD